MATEKQKEANRRNAALSTGPRTESGKHAARGNALKHGMTAETLVVLADEDPAELDGRIDAFVRDLAPGNELEAFLARRIALLSWKLDRIDRHEAAVINRLVEERAEVDRAEYQEKVRGMHVRLLPGFNDFERDGFDTTPAAELVREIESTAEGCRRLLNCWGRLRLSLDRRPPWTTTEEMAILRLSGHGPGTIDAPEALDLIVASRVFMRPNGELDAGRWDAGHFPVGLDPDALREACRRRPTDYAEAYQTLSKAIEKAATRLEIILELRERDGDDWGAGESARVAMFDAGDAGERMRRYQAATHRELIRTVDSLSKSRDRAAKREKEERSSGRPRNEPNPAPAPLRNEPNPDLAGVDEPRSMSPEISISLRNEPNLDLAGLEWIEIPSLL